MTSYIASTFCKAVGQDTLCESTSSLPRGSYQWVPCQGEGPHRYPTMLTLGAGPNKDSPHLSYQVFPAYNTWLCRTLWDSEDWFPGPQEPAEHQPFKDANSSLEMEGPTARLVEPVFRRPLKQQLHSTLGKVLTWACLNVVLPHQLVNQEVLQLLTALLYPGDQLGQNMAMLLFCYTNTNVEISSIKINGSSHLGLEMMLCRLTSSHISVLGLWRRCGPSLSISQEVG